MRERYVFLDVLRGFTLISMMLFHATWDMVYLAGFRWNWYFGTGAYVWQQSICWTFILLSGFCCSMGKRAWTRGLKRGLLVFGAGALVTGVTVFFLPEERVVFGVLTLLGSCMLLMALLQGIFRRIPTEIGLAGSFLLFFLCRNVNRGYLGFEGLKLWKLPEVLYQGGIFMTYLGFMQKGFFSTDYFSLFPWFFLYAGGYFLYRRVEENNSLDKMQQKWKELPEGFKCLTEPLAFLGRHSLLVYLLHQPVLYAAVMLLFRT